MKPDYAYSDSFHVDPVYDLKAFYSTKTGRIARRILQKKMLSIWPDTKGQSMAGVGYTMPYMSAYCQDGAENFCMIMPGHGGHAWPKNKKNRVCLIQENEWPIETGSLDRLMIVHAIEYVDVLDVFLQEAWRVLKGNGRMLVVVPNRRGLWASAEWTPFGHGTPFSASQINTRLRQNMFIHERTAHSLFMPPVRWSFVYESAPIIEKIGDACCPAFAGVHIVEVSKQLYAGNLNQIHRKKRGKKPITKTVPIASCTSRPDGC